MYIKMNTLIPTIKWSQNNEYIIVNLEINQVKNDVYEINNNNIVFTGLSNTELKYGINLELLNTVNKDESKYIVEERIIRFILKKTSDEKWIRLTKDKNQYKSNIKFNWDSFEDSDEEECDENTTDQTQYPNQQFDLSNMMNMGNNGFNIEEMMKNMNPGEMEQLMKSMNMGDNNNDDNDDNNDDNDEEEIQDEELDDELNNLINDNDDEESIDSDDLCQECA
jgi:hypothetical protein